MSVLFSKVDLFWGGVFLGWCEGRDRMERYVFPMT